MNGNNSESSSNFVFPETARSMDDTQVRVPLSRFSSRQCDISRFLGVESDKTTSGSSLTPSLSSPLLDVRSISSFTDIERVVATADSGIPGTHNGGDVELDEIYEEGEELYSDSDVYTLSPSSNDENLETAADYHSVLAFDEFTSAIVKESGDTEGIYVYSSKKMRERSKRTLSNWYQVKWESFVKSYRDKLDHFKKIFADTPVDTDKFLIAVDDIETLSKAKTAGFIPNAIEITLKSDKERYFFTSFYSRERTFAFLTKVYENSRSGGVANMEELLCQVQDVYGDECPNVLNFADGDEETSYPSNRDDLVTSTSEPNVTSTANSSQHSPNSSELVRVMTSSRHPQSRCNSHGSKLTGDEARPLRPSCSPGSASSFHLAPTQVHSPSSGGLIEGSNVAVNRNGSTNDETKGSIEMSFGRKQSGALGNDSYPALPGKLDSTTRNSSSPTKSDSEDGLVDPGLGEKTQLDAVSCGSGHEHPGRTYAAVDINVSVDALFAFLFMDSQFYVDFSAHRGNYDVQQEAWPPKPWPISDGTLQRKISYNISIKQKLFSRICRACENQTILLSETRPGMRYVIDCTVKNESVPLSNSFHVATRYCLLRRSATVSHLLVTSHVVFDRPLFFGAKSIIESVSHSTMIENFADMVDQLAKAASSLSVRERITGGSLARPHHPHLSRAATDTFRSVNNGRDSGEIGSGSEDKVNVVSRTKSDSNSPTIVTSPHQSPCGLSDPPVPPCANQQSDGRWLFMTAIILGLCVLLSMFYNRYQNAERITADHLEMTAKAAIQSGSTPTCCGELDSMRLLLNSVSEVLSQASNSSFSIFIEAQLHDDLEAQDPTDYDCT
ncbi:hypothetical protein Aperf_G00000029815 [Anoplocephala perfoliata]